ncbi:Bardet-Biedl syndrome 12 protein [Alosa sapidissima]|uniref:Bardet-Biedl syndrome 12 protein n=1 Tax=Alosa sapidissima TaxID=34773 RepID=UPI001C099625|nr:Bardet-Biedl syndrome 12 protein [Alosa sapidissima]
MSYTENTSGTNNRRHVGLEQLVTLAATAHTFLGPCKRYKFIKDDTSGDSVMVCSSFRLLENLDLTCSVGQLLSETVLAQQKVFHSGTGPLLFLVGAWSRAALECLHQGIAVRHILSAMSEGLDTCLQVCRARAVPVEDVPHLGVAQKWSALKPHAEDLPFNGHPFTESCPVSELQPNVMPLAQPTCQGNSKVLCKQTGTQGIKAARSKIKLTHSRHFTSNETTESEGPTTQRPVSQLNISENTDLDSLAFAVSHGCNEAMDLVLQASRIQSRMNGLGQSHRTFDVSKLVTCPLPGLPEDHACVMSGYVVLMSAEQASIVSRLKDQRMHIVLLNGDLSDKYRHLGFNNPAGIRHVTDKRDVHGVSREHEWVNSALATLLKYDVSVVLVNGVASEQLTDHCWRHDVLVIERVKPAVLRDFARATGAVPVSYITQVNERCVGAGVRLQVWREYRHSGRRTESSSTAVSVLAEQTALVTAVITSSVHGKLQSLEDQFWACAHHLHQALKDGRVLPGGGLVELHCIHELQKRIDNSGNRDKDEWQGEPYVGKVLQLMMDGLVDYVSTLLCNGTQVSSKVDAWTQINKRLKDLKGDSSPYVNILGLNLNEGASSDTICESVYDNVTVKMEAWRRALDLVFLVLQTDSEIITGFDAKEDFESHSFMVL